MKITTFDPKISTNAPDQIMQLFELLGFEKTHCKDNIDNSDIYFVRMKHPDGYHLDIAHSDSQTLQKDMTHIRMNVDDFDKAYEILLSHGFVNKRDDRKVETGSSVDALMQSPTGFCIHLCQHIKK